MAGIDAALVWLHRGALGLALIVVWWGANTCVAATSSEGAQEYAVKGAFLFKFGSFVEWPPTAFQKADAPLVIGIIGEDPFGAKLDQIVSGHTVEGRPVVVWRARRIEQMRDANILFISQSEKERLGAILAGLQGKNVLTVSEFEHPGVIINFVVEDNKVRFDVNLDQAERTGVKLSSKLLSVAKTVRGK
jgi:hypothetical protein